MANTSPVYARIDSDLKEKAEGILHQLGISPSSAIQMLYSQIVLTKGMPLDLHLHIQKPTSLEGMSKEEINAELMKGLDDLREGKVYTADEVDQELKELFNI